MAQAPYARDPNALAAMLRMQPAVPKRPSYAPTGIDEAFAEHVPAGEGALMDDQDAEVAAQRAQHPMGPYVVRSRDAHKADRMNAGIPVLKHLFAKQQAEAEARTAPARIAGMFGLQREQMRGQSAADVARMRAEEAAADRSARESGLDRRHESELGVRRELGTAAETGRNTRATQAQTGMDRRQTNTIGQRREERGMDKGWFDWLWGGADEEMADITDEEMALILQMRGEQP